MRFPKPWPFAGLALLVGVLLGIRVDADLLSPDVTRASRRVSEAFLMINERYVDGVDADRLAEDAIRGMLDALDPHSVYLSADVIRAENERFDGGFEGIGVSYELLEGPEGADTLSVVTVMPGGPSERAGLRTGDRIVAIDDSTAIGIVDVGVQRRLKGPRGSTVTVAVRRPGVAGERRVDIVRDRVPLETVEAAFLMPEATGYVRITRFARTTGDEFRAALSRLVEEGMERLVLDLRGNPGGLMSAAVEVSDEFLRSGQRIVEQAGRSAGTTQTFSSRGGGRWETGPVIVLVDAASASASEIVAGALQDHDRAVIVGRRTFGKGLVQNQLPLADGSAIRLTVARFLTPSGRLIQTPWEPGAGDAYREEKQARIHGADGPPADSVQVPDSLRYRTDAGRTVVALGGIAPDFEVPDDTLTAYVRTVLREGLEDRFVREWIDRDGARLDARFDGDAAKFFAGFAVTDDDLARFGALARSAGLGGPPDAAAREELRALLLGRMAVRLVDRSAWYRAFASQDRGLAHALGYWTDAERLAAGYASR